MCIRDIFYYLVSRHQIPIIVPPPPQQNTFRCNCKKLLCTRTPPVFYSFFLLTMMSRWVENREILVVLMSRISDYFHLLNTKINSKNAVRFFQPTRFSTRRQFQIIFHAHRNTIELFLLRRNVEQPSMLAIKLLKTSLGLYNSFRIDYNSSKNDHNFPKLFKVS